MFGLIQENRVVRLCDYKTPVSMRKRVGGWKTALAHGLKKFFNLWRLPTLFRWAPALQHRLLSTMHPAEKDENCLHGSKFFADP